MKRQNVTGSKNLCCRAFLSLVYFFLDKRRKWLIPEPNKLDIEWFDLIEKLKSNGKIPEIVNVCQKFATVLKEKRKYSENEISCLLSLNLSQSVLKFKDMRLLQMMNKYKIPWTIGLYRTPELKLLFLKKNVCSLKTEEFDILIEESKSMGIKMEAHCHRQILAELIFLSSKDPYKFCRILELTEIVEFSRYSNYQTSIFLYHLERIILTNNLELIKTYLTYGNIDLNQSISPPAEFIKLGIYQNIMPLHVAAKFGNLETFEYFHSMAKNKKPAVFDNKGKKYLPIDLANEDLRLNLNWYKTYHKTIRK